MPGTYCAVENCWVQTKEIAHRFPNPAKHVKNFYLWVSLCNNKRLLEQTPQEIYRNRRVCGIHFEKSDYGLNKKLKLIETAYPKLNMPANNLQIQHCITCSCMNSHDYFEITQKCYSDTVIKEVIILLVPEMVKILQDEHKVCSDCKNTLDICSKFIAQCRSVQTQLNDSKFKDTNGDLNVKFDENSQLCLEEQQQTEFRQFDNIQNNMEIQEECEIETEEGPILKYITKERSMHTKFDQSHRIISLSQSDGNLKLLTDKFHDNGLSVHNRSEMLYNGSTSKRILLLTSQLCKFCGKSSLNEHKCSDPYTQRKKIPAKSQKLKYYCKKCEMRFSTHPDYKQHLIKRHYIKCEICSLWFLNSDMLDKHKLRTHGIKDEPERFLCEICGQDFNRSHAFSGHMITHKEQIEYFCEICGRLFNRKHLIDEHKLTHQEKKFECDRCSKKFVSPKYLNRHIQRSHIPDETNTRLQCDECGKLLKNYFSLQSHRKHVHPKTDPLQCPECPRKYATLFYLRRHIKYVHRKIKKKIGSKKVVTRNSTEKYKSFNKLRTYSSTQLVPCKTCGKYIKGIHNLKIHLTTHILTKRLACKYCGITLKNPNSLKKHEGLHMNDENMCRCNVCWKKFKTIDERDRHMVIHNKPRHQCSECGEYFHRIFLLNNHMLLEHSNPEELENSLTTFINETIDALNEEKIEIISNKNQEEIIEYKEVIANQEKVIKYKEEGIEDQEEVAEYKEVIGNQAKVHEYKEERIADPEEVAEYKEVIGSQAEVHEYKEEGIADPEEVAEYKDVIDSQEEVDEYIVKIIQDQEEVAEYQEEVIEYAEEVIEDEEKVTVISNEIYA